MCIRDSLKALWSRYREGSQAIDNLKAAMTVEEIEGKTQTINGKEESVAGYQVQVSKEAFAEFLTATKEFIMADEAFKTDVVEYFDIMANSYKLGGMTMNGEAIPGGEAIWAQLGEAMEQGIDSIGQYVGCLLYTSSVGGQPDGPDALRDHPLLLLPDSHGGQRTGVHIPEKEIKIVREL